MAGRTLARRAVMSIQQGAADMPNTRGLATKRLVRGVVFDMDGTLTVPCLDFSEMRRRIGLTEPTGDILAVVRSWDLPRRDQALKEIHSLEIEALQMMALQSDVIDVCQKLDALGIPRALVTRNMKESVDFFHSHKFPLPKFYPALCRETFPEAKPSPAPLLHIASTWGLHPSELAMVGDSMKDDVVSGNRAGALTIFLSQDPVTPLTEEMQPHFQVSTLTDALEVLTEQCTLEALAPPATPN